MPAPGTFPIHTVISEAVLPAERVADLFGAGYKLKGSEKVRIMRGADVLATLPLRTCSHLDLRLDATDQARIGSHPARIVGPRGYVEVQKILPLKRRLIVPAPLLSTWTLKAGQLVAVHAGTVIFGHVEVTTGDTLRLVLPRTDVLSAGVAEGDAARIFTTDAFAPAPEVSEVPTVAGKLITENDIRQARIKRRKINVQPGQILTPAARSLGLELGVLLFEERKA